MEKNNGKSLVASAIFFGVAAGILGMHWLGGLAIGFIVIGVGAFPFEVIVMHDQSRRD